MRDYGFEMNGIIDSERTGSDPAVVVAMRIVQKLAASDPDLLDGYMDLNKVNVIRDAVAFRDRSERSRTRIRASRVDFARAVAAGEVIGFLDVHYVVEGHRIPLGQMTGGDLRWVAQEYDATAREALMEKAFFTALAKRVGKGLVSDHFTEAQIAALRASLP
jgi:hypothetical protein